MTEELLTCPYDPIHQISRQKMPSHLVKCKRNYSGPPLEVCPFNAFHFVKDVKEHLPNCPDYATAEQGQLLQDYLRAKQRDETLSAIGTTRSGSSQGSSNGN